MIDTSATAKAAAETATSIDRWDDEGGAQFPSRKEIGELGERERHILECLGAAVVGVWSTLPTSVQRAVFEYAAAQRSYDTAELRVQIARFLHAHKNP